MKSISQVAASDSYPPVQEEVARLSGAPQVRAAFERFRSQESQFALWQLEATRVAAPPFGEVARRAFPRTWTYRRTSGRSGQRVGGSAGVRQAFCNSQRAYRYGFSGGYAIAYQAGGQSSLWPGSFRQWRGYRRHAGGGECARQHPHFAWAALSIYWKCWRRR